MLLDVVRLRDSDLVSADAEIFRVAVLSWCVAWHQVPAGSIPDDNVVLARLLGFGRDVAAWVAVRAAGGLRGWTQASDGRLYHPVVVEKVLAALDTRAEQRAKTKAARLAALAKREAERLAAEKSVTESVTDRAQKSVTDSATDPVTSSKGREGKVREEKVTLTPPSPAAPPASEPTAPGGGDGAVSPESLRSRIAAVDKSAVRKAIGIGALIGLVRVFGASVTPHNEQEWPREANGLQIGVVAVIFWEAMANSSPIRQPSGFRKVRTAWESLGLEDRRAIAAEAMADLGIETDQKGAA